MWAQQVFRGVPYKEVMELSKISYKNDFKLVAKDEEEHYIKRTLTSDELESTIKVLPEFTTFPPLLEVSRLV